MGTANSAVDEMDAEDSPDSAGRTGRPRLVDVLITIVYSALALVLFALAEIYDDGSDPWTLPFALVILVGNSFAVLFRRRWTVSMAILVLALGAISVLRGNGVEVIAIAIMLFSLAVFRPPRITALFLALFVALIVAGVVFPSDSQRDIVSLGILALSGALVELPALLLLLFIAAFGLLLGVVVRSRRRAKDALVERAAQLEREQEQLAQLAAATERTRIAREMHDIVSHTLTVVVTLADGAIESNDHAASRLAMSGAADAARGALTDLRRLLGALHGGGNAPLAPQPDARALPELIAQFVRVGLPARLVIQGEPDDDPAVSFAIYRVVQEGLTNALRYSRSPQRADVSIDYGDEGVDLVIENDGALSDAPSVGAGQGLLGLRERLDLLNGGIEIGPVEDGVWRLQAWIPRSDEKSGGAMS